MHFDGLDRRWLGDLVGRRVSSDLDKGHKPTRDWQGVCRCAHEAETGAPPRLHN